jgi:methanogenic corrinoid protein MtbC1
MACYDPNLLTSKFIAQIRDDRSQDAGVINRRQIIYNRIEAAQGSPGSRKSSRADLEHTIETEILPRLMMAHKQRASSMRSVPEAAEHFGARIDIDKFSSLIISADISESDSFVDALYANGACLDAIYLDLLSPTARRLGKLWDDDLCTCADVAVGLSRLHQILSRLSPSFVREGETRGQKRRAVMSTLPGDQHTFGLVMAVDFFRRAGWDVIGWPLATGDRVEEIVRCDAFDMIGLSVSEERQLDLARAVIEAVRRASRNRMIVVMVGGRVFNDHPEFVQQIGADGSGEHGLQAVEKAENLVAQLARQC